MATAEPWVTRDSLIVSVAKGIEACSSKRMTEVLTEVLPAHPCGRHRCTRRTEPRP